MSTTHPNVRTTEWDDLQIKYGNYAPPEPEVKAEEVSQQQQELVASINPLAGKTVQELKELEEEAKPDEEFDIIAERRRRLAELKERAKRMRFGEVYEIGAEDYVEQVTVASKDAIVICHLYKDSKPECVMLNRFLEKLATEHRDVKFVKGVSSRVVPNFKEENLPALLIYRNGECWKQIIGTSFFGGKSMSAESVEWGLAKQCKLFETQLLENPLNAGGHNRRGRKGVVLGTYSSSSEEEEEEGGGSYNTAGRQKAYGDAQVESVMKGLLGGRH